MNLEDYTGREQTFLKHQVLKQYLAAWIGKLGSVGRFKTVRLWYVDCFAGPWNTQSGNLDDTSVAIALRELNAVRDEWASRGNTFDVGAIFVERDEEAFQRLQRLVAERRGNVQVTTYPGEFGNHVQDIDRQLARDPALLFVDPTGWKGAAMSYIAPLLRVPKRDVIVNVMYNFVARAAGMQSHQWLQEQLRDFFSVEVPAGLDEAGLMQFYRDQLRLQCRLSYVADLAIAHPTQERTWFRLVVGGRHPEVVRLFRDIERDVVGERAAVVRMAARQRVREERTGALEFNFGPPAGADQRYAEMNAADRGRARDAVFERLESSKRMRYSELWPQILERLHITLSDLGAVVADLRREGAVVVEGWGKQQRVPKDQQWLMLRSAR